jgi:hypothetical protein
MPASRARAARPGWRRAIAATLILMLPALAAAQDNPAPAPRAGAAARPHAGAVGPGMGPLQTEPGDIWAEVRSWTQGKGRAESERARPAETAGRQNESASSRQRRAEPCATTEQGCARKPSRSRADPG